MDPTEALRRQEVQELNTNPGDRAALEARYGRVWDTDELSQDFAVEGFLAPYVVVRERATGKLGSLRFQHHPRFYFQWEEDT